MDNIDKNNYNIRKKAYLLSSDSYRNMMNKKYGGHGLKEDIHRVFDEIKTGGK